MYMKLYSSVLTVFLAFNLHAKTDGQFIFYEMYALKKNVKDFVLENDNIIRQILKVTKYKDMSLV